MDLEHLNKSQIILLTLLVSFVTSIATGIVAVTLMEQAPPAITQTVNRVVERTVERVVPDAGHVAAAANVVTEKIVTIREEDLIAKAVQGTDASVVRLFTSMKDASGKETQSFVGIALVINSEGVLLADSGTPEGALTALRSDGIEIPVKALPGTHGSPMLHLQAPTSTSVTIEGTTESKPLSWKPAVFSTVSPSLGEAVVVINGRTSTRVARGIITALSSAEGKDSDSIVETDLSADEFVAGSPLINTDGEIIGIATRTSRLTPGGFLASSAVLLDNSVTEEPAAP